VIDRRTWLTLALGAIAGAGVTVAALALRPGPKPCEASFDDGGAGAALRARAAAPTGGALYRVGDGHQSKERCLVDMPRGGGRVVSLPLDGGRQARVLAKDHVRRILFRDLDVFLATWRPVEAPVVEKVGGRELVRSTWGGPEDDGWALREVWVDRATNAFVRMRDRTRDGHTIHEVELLARAPRTFDPVRTLFGASYVAVPEPRLNPGNVPRFDEFVRRVGLALYLPSRIPARLQRVDYAYEDRVAGRTRSGAEKGLPVACVTYGDGVSLLNFVCADPSDLDLLTELSRSAQGAGRDMTCPSLPADTPEDILGVDGQIRVRRRTNGCLTVLRRDGLPGGVSVVLVCQGGMPAEVPLELIRGLVRVQVRDRPLPEAVGSPDATPILDVTPVRDGAPGGDVAPARDGATPPK